VPTNEQRRATAKRKLERQLERRAKQAKRRRIIVIIGGVVASVAVIAAVVTTVVVSHKDQKNKAAPSTTSAASSTPTESTSGAPTPAAAALPAFQPSAGLGADCQYPASQDAATKPVKPPRTGKVPTDPATISASMSTNQGNIGLLLANNESPCTVNSFASLAGQKFFNDTKCHRLTTNPDLAVLQCGDPKGDGTGGPGYGFANEYPTDQYPPNDPKLQQAVIYPRGTLAMAHSKLPNSNGSQFFLVYKDSQLPPDYTVFGKIQDDGLAVLDKIAKGGVAGGGEDGSPALEVTIKSVLLD
jgi:peptidyl-prolyl cis-trans isomerase B (cyclophilin B)